MAMRNNDAAKRDGRMDGRILDKKVGMKEERGREGRGWLKEINRDAPASQRIHQQRSRNFEDLPFLFTTHDRIDRAISFLGSSS